MANRATHALRTARPAREGDPNSPCPAAPFLARRRPAPHLGLSHSRATTVRLSPGSRRTPRGRRGQLGSRIRRAGRVDPVNNSIIYTITFTSRTKSYAVARPSRDRTAATARDSRHGRKHRSQEQATLLSVAPCDVARLGGKARRRRTTLTRDAGDVGSLPISSYRVIILCNQRNGARPRAPRRSPTLPWLWESRRAHAGSERYSSPSCWWTQRGFGPGDAQERVALRCRSRGIQRVAQSLRNALQAVPDVGTRSIPRGRGATGSPRTGPRRQISRSTAPATRCWTRL